MTDPQPQLTQDADGWYIVVIPIDEYSYEVISPYFMSEGAAREWLEQHNPE